MNGLYLSVRSVEILTVGTVVVVDLLEAGGTGAGVRLVAGQTQVAAPSVIGATAILAPYRRKQEEHSRRCMFLCCSRVQIYVFMCFLQPLLGFSRGNLHIASDMV